MLLAPELKVMEVLYKVVVRVLLHVKDVLRPAVDAEFGEQEYVKPLLDIFVASYGLVQ